MSELPTGWTESPLSELVEILDARRIPLNSDERNARIKDRAPQELFPYYGAAGQVGTIDGYLFQGEHILLGEDGVPFFDRERHKAYRANGRFWVNNHAHVLKAIEDLSDSTYIEGFLNCFDYEGFVTGSTRLKLTQGAMRTIPVKLAPYAEQKRIADKLDALLARVDACRERFDRIPFILKSFRQSVLAAATSGALTENWRMENQGRIDATGLAEKVHAAHHAAGGHQRGNAAAPSEDAHDLTSDMFPASWCLLDLRDVVTPGRPITYGILKPGPELESGVKYVRVADFPGDKLNLDGVRMTSAEMDEAFKRSRLRPGDLLLSIRGTVGRAIVIPAELDGANITQDSARLSISALVNSNYVLLYLRAPLAQSRMKRAIKGVAVRGINIGDVRALQVPLPSSEEQTEIVRRVEALFALADRIEARYKSARARVEQLTPALLAKAFRGELVPQDPNDEPASVLLDRIRAERAAAGPTKPKRGRKARERA